MVIIRLTAWFRNFQTKKVPLKTISESLQNENLARILKNVKLLLNDFSMKSTSKREIIHPSTNSTDTQIKGLVSLGKLN